MQYVASVEREAIAKGREEGLIEGEKNIAPTIGPPRSFYS